MSTQNEGWQLDKHPHQRVYHYIREGMSLCRKLGFYRGDLTPDEPEKRTRQDCAQCIKKLAPRNSGNAVEPRGVGVRETGDQ